ncbi:MAG: acyl carrier protein [Phycisphaera sp.]|nr:acyl carrier protein [Phycisphaera sp.]
MAKLTDEQTLEKVREVLVDALGVDDDEVTPEATLVGDLGAESIDFLDIAFRLEKAFGIKIEEGEMMPANVINDPRYVADGKVTDAGLDELKKRMPHANLDTFAQTRSVEDFPNVFTVEAVVNFVKNKLG